MNNNKPKLNRTNCNKSPQWSADWPPPCVRPWLTCCSNSSVFSSLVCWLPSWSSPSSSSASRPQNTSSLPVTKIRKKSDLKTDSFNFNHIILYCIDCQSLTLPSMVMQWFVSYKESRSFLIFLNTRYTKNWIESSLKWENIIINSAFSLKLIFEILSRCLLVLVLWLLYLGLLYFTFTRAGGSIK